MRMVSVWLPALPIERLKRETTDKPFPDDRPFALIDSADRGLVLAALNAAARYAGLFPGLSLADARAICPHLVTAPAAPDKDRRKLTKLARWASRYSPNLNVDGEDGLWLDVTGIPHLFGGEDALLADMAARLRRVGFSASLALAETLGGAHALARFEPASPIAVPDGCIKEALAQLPVEALRLCEDVVRLLRRLGLKRIGQLYDLPRVSLERRFHASEAAEAVLRRLDQALGRRDEVLTPLFPIPDFMARLSFPDPLISHEGILCGLDHLACELCQALAEAHLGARRVRLAVYRADGSTAIRFAGFSAPCREPAHLLRILQEKIESIDAGFGVDLMALAAISTEPLGPAQTAFARSAAREPQEPLIDRLANRLSPGAVRRLAPRQSHLPERAQAALPAFAGAFPWPEPEVEKAPRPMLLFAEPEPLTVLAEVPEGPPARFTWRCVSRRVVKAEGPERIAPEWWLGLRHAQGKQTLPRTRDYYRIEDEEGCRYWVFREGLYQESEHGPPCWFLHGVFA